MKNQEISVEAPGNVVSRLAALGYDTVREDIFKIDSPEISTWYKVFADRTPMEEIFTKYLNASNDFKKGRRIAAGVLWYEFSAFSVWYLCQSSASLSDNLKRHYIVQFAFEELGMRDHEEIHCELFRQAAVSAEVSEQHFDTLLGSDEIENLFSWLRGRLLGYENDASIIGLNLGMEFPAEENISTVQTSLSENKEIAEIVANSRFFKVHNVIEAEHIRAGIANFLRFCPDDKAKRLCLEGFDDGILFWKRYWQIVEDVAKSIETN